MARTKSAKIQFLICVSDQEPDLQKGKLYQFLPDESAAKSKYVRVIDDSGEDYLYPAKYFVAIDLPQDVKKVLLQAS